MGYLCVCHFLEFWKRRTDGTYTLHFGNILTVGNFTKVDKQKEMRWRVVTDFKSCVGRVCQFFAHADVYPKAPAC